MNTVSAPDEMFMRASKENMLWTNDSSARAPA